VPGQRVFEQVIVSNVDLVLPVFAVANPAPKWGLLDRYLVSAEAAELPSVIVINKCDLADRNPGLDEEIEIYRRIGYPVLLVSAVTGEGIEELKQALQGRLSVLVGKSGVGKTSLLNALQPGLGLRVKAVGAGKLGKGRHTTTHLEMFELEFSGALVDTPGMREFGLWDARNLYPHNYSRGMRLKLGLLIALIRPFKVLLLDEPTSALDIESVSFLVKRLKELRQSGASILLSSHDPNIARELADRTLKIQNGYVRDI